MAGLSELPRTKATYIDWSRQQELPPFYHPQWLDLLCGRDHWQVVFTADSHEEITACWPFAVKKKWGMTALLNPVFTPYCGPWYLHPPTQADYEQLVKQLPPFAILEQKTPLQLENTEWLQKFGFRLFPKTTYTLALQPTEEELFKNFKGSLRRQIRKGVKSLELTSDRKYYHAFSQLIVEHLRPKISSHLPNVDTLQTLLGLIEQHQWGKVFIAMDGKKMAGGLVVVRSGRYAIYLISSQNERGKRKGAVSFMMWEAIKWAREQELELFDFEGSSIESIARFFRNFGATQQTAIAIRKVNHPLVKLYYRLKGY